MNNRLIDRPLAEGDAYSFMTLRSFSEDLGSLYRDGTKITGKLFLEYFLDEWSWVLSVVALVMLVGAGADGVGVLGEDPLPCWAGGHGSP